jgi:phosphoribosylcarboxyaminoimidazole (NCAIR) mutase
MPAGIPVATFPIGKKGSVAAARFVIALFQHLP